MGTILDELDVVIATHNEVLEKTLDRLKNPSTSEQLKMAKRVLLKNKAELYVTCNDIDGLSEYMQDRFEVLHKRYTDIINLIDNVNPNPYLKDEKKEPTCVEDLFTNEAPSNLFYKLNEIMKDRTKTRVSPVFDVLEELNYISAPARQYGGWKTVHKLFSLRFGDIGDYSTVNDNRGNKGTPSEKQLDNREKEKQKIKKILGVE